MNKRVLLGMSGGVDSSVAAHLLRHDGYDVMGVFLRFFEGQNSENAEIATRELGVPFYVADVSKNFSETVIPYFIDSYKNAKTPNPCIMCNPLVKFAALTAQADVVGADFISTGHYARVTTTDKGRFALQMASDSRKDQTYMLYRLSQEQLSRIIFPCGMYTKDVIRQVAAENGQTAAETPDSQEICFIQNGDYVSFLKENGVTSEPGNFIDTNGRVIGTHPGAIHYTIGQRKGLQMGFGERRYVTAVNTVNNTVTLGYDEDLFTDTVYVTDVVFSGMKTISDGTPSRAKVRYSQRMSDCILYNTENGLKAVFDTKQRAVTPGQSAVFYSGDIVIAGGVIR